MKVGVLFSSRYEKQDTNPKQAKIPLKMKKAAISVEHKNPKQREKWKG